MIRANVRTPDETVGDLYAQTACNEVGAREPAASSWTSSGWTTSSRSPTRSSRAPSARCATAIARAARRRLHRTRRWSDGFDEPIRIEVTVTDRRRRGRRSTSPARSPQSPSRHQRGAELHPRLRLVRDQGRDQPGGAAQRGRVPAGPRRRRRAGSILNCREPAAVAARHVDRPLPAGHDLRRAGARRCRAG